MIAAILARLASVRGYFHYGLNFLIARIFLHQLFFKKSNDLFEQRGQLQIKTNRLIKDNCHVYNARKVRIIDQS